LNGSHTSGKAVYMYASSPSVPDMAVKDGSVGIGTGTTAPSSKLQLLSTTEQFRSGYDASNYWNATTGSTGITTFNAAGSGAGFNFAGGNVGIGTTSPAFKLDVAGSARFTDNVLIGDAAGDSHVVRGSITAQDATAVGANDLANVGALDARYLLTYWPMPSMNSNPRQDKTVGGPAITYGDAQLSLTTGDVETNFALQYYSAYEGQSLTFDSSNRKVFGTNFGWAFRGYCGCREISKLHRIIIGGVDSSAESYDYGNLASTGICIESISDTANNPKFRILVKTNNTTLTTGVWSGVIASSVLMYHYWLVQDAASCYLYGRENPTAAWSLICSVAAVPSGSITSGRAFSFCRFVYGASAGTGGKLTAYRLVETYGSLP